MRQKLIKSVCLFGGILSLTGCGEMNSGDPNADEYYNRIEESLSNAKVQNIESYSQLGYVTKTNQSNKKKGTRKNAYFGKGLTQSCRYLAGMIGEEVAALVLDNETSFFDIPIEVYGDLGSFIGFSPMYYQESNLENYQYFSWASSHGFGILEEHRFDYILSKKTGKIYKTHESNGNIDWRFSSLIFGKEALYAKYERSDEEYVSYWAAITEENEQLVITKSNMLEFLQGSLYADARETFYDKYGNILIGQTIYGYDQKKLTPNIGGVDEYRYEPYTQTIYACCEDAYYVLEGLEFKRYDNVIFGSDGIGEYYRQHGCYFDGNGELQILALNSETDKIYCTGKETIERKTSSYTDEYGNTCDNAEIVYYIDENGVEHNLCLKRQHDHDWWTFFGDAKELDISLLWCSIGNNWREYETEYIYGNYVIIGMKVCKKFDAYTLWPIRQISVDGTKDSLFRDQYMYSITSNYKLMKHDFIRDVTLEVDTSGYQIKTISKDSYGNIVLTGYDSSFKEFAGYLDENDQVTFEPTSTGNGEYDIIYMNPVN